MINENQLTLNFFNETSNCTSVINLTATLSIQVSLLDKNILIKIVRAYTCINLTKIISKCAGLSF